VKSGQDEAAYTQMERLRSNGSVTPLVVGRLFEEADIVLLLHSTDMEALDDYLVKNVRSIEDVQELIVVPIYKFKLLSSFDFMIEPEPRKEGTSLTPYESEELLFFMARLDVAPTKDLAVSQRVSSIKPTDNVIPMMMGHTFHSKEFDLALFFLAKSLESAWEFVKALRVVDGVWDTDVDLMAHFEALTTLKRFKELASTVPAKRAPGRRVRKRKVAK